MRYAIKIRHVITWGFSLSSLQAIPPPEDYVIFVMVYVELEDKQVTWHVLVLTHAILINVLLSSTDSKEVNELIIKHSRITKSSVIEVVM